MRVERVSREDLVEAAAELLPGAGRPPELALPALGAREARYLAELRHGAAPPAAVALVAREAGRPVAVAGVLPSPFDEEVFGPPSARIVGFEALTREAAEALADEALASASGELGARFVQARVAPASPGLAALASRGLAAFGATVLYAGEVGREGEAKDGRERERVERVEGGPELEAAARAAGEARFESHLARDPRLPAGKERLVYERWVRSEADRGATVLLSRDEGGEPAGVAVLRASPLAPRLLGLELWHLHVLAVAAPFEGRGHGARLARAALAEAAAAGATLLQTGADTAALAAARLYARLGLLPRAASLALHGWLG